MKKELFTLLLLLVAVSSCVAEAFYIRQYDVDIQLNSNGSVDVRERIQVYFTEQRRGIIRSIPFRYKAGQTGFGERARRESQGPYYETIIKEVRVKDDPFQLFRDGPYLKIRIGDPDVYLSGDHLYEISYTVWGALNEFSRHVEFSWNLVGHEWYTQIEEVDFEIRFPKPIHLEAADFLLFTGSKGSREKDARHTLGEQAVSGSVTRPLRAGEGMTAALRFPKNYFDNITIPTAEYADTYYIRSHRSEARLNADASIDVEEVYEVEFLKRTFSFTRVFETFPVEDDEGNARYLFIDEEHIFNETSPAREVIYRIRRESDKDYLSVEAQDAPFTGSQTFVFRYRIWGAVVQKGGSAQVKWEILHEGEGEPVEQTAFSLSLPPGLELKSRVFVDSETEPAGNVLGISYDETAGRISGRSNARLLLDGRYQLDFAADPRSFNFSSIPFQVYAQYFVIDQLDTDIFLQGDGTARVRHQFQLDFIYPFNREKFQPYIRTLFDERAQSGQPLLELPERSFLSPKYRPFISNVHCGNEDQFVLEDRGDRKVFALRDPAQSDWERTFSYEYEIFGLLKAKGNRYQLHFPVVYPLDDPVKKGTFKVHFPDVIEADEVSFAFERTGGDSLEQTRTWATYVSGELSRYLRPGEAVTARVEFPGSYLPGSRWRKTARLLLANNRWVLLSLLALAFLSLLWYLIGRDEKPTMVVRFYPPEDLTPAEAGFIWDDKLHKKDLISLIYYWAAAGHLKIVEGKRKHKRDYTLVRKAPLAVGAKPFERTIFDGLFEGGKSSVKVSSLRNSFYTTMNEAHRQLERYGKQKGFFVPGTRGFGTVMKVIGYVLTGFSLILLGISFVSGDYSFSIPAAVIGLALIFFGYFMPKKAHFGVRKYAEIIGFREFVRRAEIDRLKVLVEENPHYFEETVAYAIVFGLGHQWALKFKDLITEPPDWYEGRDHRRAFDTVYLTNHMLSSMHRMNKDFNYRMPESSGSSSWSGGGGSMFGGGGFSGGGFGGGGGSSW